MPRILLIGEARALENALRRHPSLADADLDWAAGNAHALRFLRRQCYDAVVTDPRTTIDEDLALLDEMRQIRPGVKVILLSRPAGPEEVIKALRARVFACAEAPLSPPDVADLVRLAVAEADGRDGIEVLSATRDWVSLRIDCRFLTAERVLSFLGQLRAGDLPRDEADELMAAFREILLNAIEHGGGLDPGQAVEIAAVRTARAIVFYVRDPGPGFRLDDLPHAAISSPEGDPLSHTVRRAEAGLRPGGFGLLLARSIADEMFYSEKGNEVVLVKHTA
jgi:anti-sigma regulatory factor (Ser/Thr protein kinase)/ActR/RegA family two-component response regulator